MAGMMLPGVDPRDLAQAGWGVIFHERESPEVQEALQPLLEHRKSQAGRHFEHLYQEFRGESGLRDGESKEDFLAKNDAPAGAVNPDRMPYYLLIVGDPKLIPFHFQQQLDTQHAVGRICFDTLEEYANYAKSVVEVEAGHVPRDRRITLFGVRNPDDLPTKASTDFLVLPLADHLATRPKWQKQHWELSSLIGEEATKERLVHLLRGQQSPALLFTASHGMNFSFGDPLQRNHQGALLCQDWPGPERWQKFIPPDYYFSGDDVEAKANLQGMIAFHLASHSVGTPAFDEFESRNKQAIAPYPFAAYLPQRLLGHPNGGALAVIGHVGTTWPYSFFLTVTKIIGAFETAIRVLMDGFPVGFSLAYFNQYYSEAATDFALALQKLGSDKEVDPIEVSELWMAQSHAQKFSILGDPAVRLVLR